MIEDDRIMAVGTRVELHPATDRWMMGDRFGEVVKVTSKIRDFKITRTFVHVRMDRSGKTIRFGPEDLIELYQPISR